MKVFFRKKSLVFGKLIVENYSYLPERAFSVQSETFFSTRLRGWLGCCWWWWNLHANGALKIQTPFGGLSTLRDGFLSFFFCCCFARRMAEDDKLLSRSMTLCPFRVNDSWTNAWLTSASDSERNANVWLLFRALIDSLFYLQESFAGADVRKAGIQYGVDIERLYWKGIE